MPGASVGGVSVETWKQEINRFFLQFCDRICFNKVWLGSLKRWHNLKGPQIVSTSQYSKVHDMVRQQPFSVLGRMKSGSGSIAVLWLEVPSSEFCTHFLMRLLIISNLIYHDRVTTIADKLRVDWVLIHQKRDGKGRDAPEHMEILVGDVRDKVDYCFCFW